MKSKWVAKEMGLSTQKFKYLRLTQPNKVPELVDDSGKIRYKKSYVQWWLLKNKYSNLPEYEQWIQLRNQTKNRLKPKMNDYSDGRILFMVKGYAIYDEEFLKHAKEQGFDGTDEMNMYAVNDFIAEISAACEQMFHIYGIVIDVRCSVHLKDKQVIQLFIESQTKEDIEQMFELSRQGYDSLRSVVDWCAQETGEQSPEFNSCTEIMMNIVK